MKTILIKQGPDGYFGEVITERGSAWLRRYRGIPVADKGEPTVFKKKATAIAFARKYSEIFGGKISEEI